MLKNWFCTVVAVWFAQLLCSFNQTGCFELNSSINTHPPKIYLHPLPPTHTKCLYTPNYPKYTYTHPHSPIKNVNTPPPTQNIPPPTQSTHIKHPFTPVYLRYTSTHPHSFLLTNKNFPPSPTHLKCTSNLRHPPTKNVCPTTLTQNLPSPNYTLP